MKKLTQKLMEKYNLDITKAVLLLTAAAAALVILVAVVAAVIVGAVQKSSFANDYLMGRTFYYEDVNSRTEYDILSGGKCVIREQDISGYHITETERDAKYKLEKGGDGWAITIDGTYYKVSASEFSVSLVGSQYMYEKKDALESGRQLESVVNFYNSSVYTSESGTESSTVNKAADDDYISAAKQIAVKDIITYGDSAKWYSSKVYARDDYGRAVVYLDVSVPNAFGVYSRHDLYIFISSINPVTHTFTYPSVFSYVEGESYVNYLKEINDFGVNPDEDEEDNKDDGEAYVLKYTQANRESQTVHGGISMDVFNIYNSVVDFYFYVDTQSNTVEAIQLKARAKAFTYKAEREEMLDAFWEMAEAMTGDAHIGEYAVVHDGDALQEEAIFVKGGYIIKAHAEEHWFYLTITNGRKYGFTETDYWTPLGSVKAGDSTENTEPTEPETEPTAAQCSHNYTAATCTAPATCTICGVTTGTALKHQYAAVGCTTPAVCSVCGDANGYTPGHNYLAATCTTPATCKVCGATEGDPAGHTWQAATCTETSICTVCQQTSGEPLGHDIYITECRNCDHVDFSSFARSYPDAYASVYDPATDEDYGVDHVNLSADGVFSFTFKGVDYALELRQREDSDAQTVYFECYFNGKREPEALVQISSDPYTPLFSWFNVERCDIIIYAEGW